MTIIYQLSPSNFDSLPTSPLSAVVCCCCCYCSSSSSSPLPSPPPSALPFLFSPFFTFPISCPSSCYFYSFLVSSSVLPVHFCFLLYTEEEKHNPRRALSSRMWRCIAGCLVPGVSKELISSVFSSSWSLDRCARNTTSQPKPPEYSIMSLWKPRNVRPVLPTYGSVATLKDSRPSIQSFPLKLIPTHRGSHCIIYFRTHPRKYKMNKYVMSQGLLYSTTYFSEKRCIRHLSTRVAVFSNQRKYLLIRKRDSDFRVFPILLCER